MAFRTIIEIADGSTRDFQFYMMSTHSDVSRPPCYLNNGALCKQGRGYS